MRDTLHVTVMGLGLNGGGLATALYFAERGAVVTVTDMKNEKELAPSIEALKDFNIRYVLGRHELDDFKNADMVIKNPGVKAEGNIFLAAARKIETDISLFLQNTRSPIIAVTGSKGKSSTVSAIHFALQETYTKQSGYECFLGGNITVSPLSFLEKTSEHTPTVLELSSWQLADLKGRGVLKPKIALITTIVPDHLNWYGTMEKYVADKKLIYADQSNNSTDEDTQYTICKYDDYWGDIFARETKAQVLRYCANGTALPVGVEGVWLENGVGTMRLNKNKASELILPAVLAVPGMHSRENLLNASLCVCLMGVSPSLAADALARYTGIAHRLERFYKNETLHAVFYNDSASTVPEASVAAINSFETPPVLLCGGTDKQLDFTILAENAHKVHKLFLLAGSGTDKLIPLLKKKNISYEGDFTSLESALTSLNRYLQEEVQNTNTAQESETIVVFSPGATSFGMFKNEFDRGNCFKEAVKKVFE